MEKIFYRKSAQGKHIQVIIQVLLHMKKKYISMHQVGGMGIHRWQLMIIWDNTLSVAVVYLDLSANSRLLIGIAMSVERKKKQLTTKDL